MTAYSPTETTDYLFCPQYRAYRWSGRWRARVAGRMDLGGVLGKSVHAGLACYYRGSPEPSSAAITMAHDNLVRLAGLGITWPADLAPEAAALPVKAGWAVQKFLTVPALAWHVLAVEQRLGHGVVDLVVEDREGPLVVETKTALRLESRYQAAKLASYGTAWQLWDYCHRVSEWLQRPVTRALVQLIILGPVFHVARLPLVFNNLERWLQHDAWPVWQRMEADEGMERPPRNMTRCHDDGYRKPCAFYGVCWEGRSIEETHVQEPERERSVES